MATRRISFSGRWNKSEKERIRRILAKWRKRLLLEDWTFSVEIVGKPSKDGPDTILADVNPLERYRSAHIRIYPRFWLEARQEQERSLVHEVIHAPINRVHNLIHRLVAADLANRDEVEAAVEQLTEHWTNVAWDAYQSRRK